MVGESLIPLDTRNLRFPGTGVDRANSVGGIGLAFGLADLRTVRTGGRGRWVVTYPQRMVGAFMATVSAVSAVNPARSVPSLGRPWR